MQDVIQTISKIAEILLPVHEQRYKNANDLFENYMTPARIQAKKFSNRYLSTFEKLLTTSLETPQDVLLAIDIVNESSRRDYQSRRDFISFVAGLKGSLENKILKNKFRDSAYEFYFCVTQVFLGQCEHQVAVGTPYTALLSGLTQLQCSTNDEELRKNSVYWLRGFCKWGISNQTKFMAKADRAFFKYKAALAPQV